jgi:hypothetical protein
MRMWTVSFALLAACYSPQVSPGAPCSPEGTCPGSLTCVEGTCVPPGTPGTDAATDAASPDATPDAPPDASMSVPPDAFVDLSLIAHWEFDDAPSDGALDSTGRGHTGTCTTACPTLVTGKIGMGYHFDSSSQQALGVPDSADFRGTFTLAAWMYADSTGDSMAIMSKPQGNDTGNSWQLELRDTRKLSFSGGSTHYLETNNTFSAGAWHHVAGTWDGTKKRIYVDGVLVNSVDSSITYDTHLVYLGADQNGGSMALHWDGTLDDVRIYNRVLSASEIAALAQ